MDPELASLREDYRRGGLSEADLDSEPMVQFGRWFTQVRDSGVVEPNAMVLATVSADGSPAARSVLLKGYAARGFTFFTNHRSRKGRELLAEPRCALTFTWVELQRQVRVEGRAEPLARADSEAYFATRPRDSQLGAWASPQSEVVTGREDLEARYARVTEEYADREVPCPPYWGGFLVRPHRVEFWQGRHGRMHDRLAYVSDDPGSAATWRVERLAP